MASRKKINKDGAHQFAFYISDLANCFKNQSIIISDTDVVHRITRVIRLTIGDQVTLFDTKQHVTAQIAAIDKRSVVVAVLEQKNNVILTPGITYLLPLLKKEALADAVYSLAEIGVTTIQLVVTAKSRQNITDKEFERLHKSIIAAAEQAKHYAMPELKKTKQLFDCVTMLPAGSAKIMFDVQGTSFFELHNSVKDTSVCLVVGPEGGLTNDEIKELQKHSFVSCVLTSTILRAVQAVPLSAGLFRLQ